MSASVRPLRWATALIAVSTLALTGCGGSSAAQDAVGAGKKRTAALAATVPKGTVLRIGDQNEALQTLLKASGQDQGTPYKLEFSSFQGGPSILEAFRGGALDAGIVAETPAIFAQASKQDVAVVGVQQGSRNASRLVTAVGSSAKSVADLKGKKIAYTEGTTFQPAVLKALKNAGLKKDDVQLVNLQILDIPAALQTKQVDAAVLTEPLRSKYLVPYAAKGAHLLDDATDLTSGLQLLISPGKAVDDKAKAAALRDLTARWTKASKWANAHPQEWVKAYYVDAQKLPEKAGLLINKATGTATFPTYDEAAKAQQEVADLLIEAGAVPGPLDVSSEFDHRFEAAQQEAAK
ncbi:aliphatic sulfonate ABC transporter substrate-binding protein [Streptomyces sp. NBC_01465]|uniref:aliphatic sulfonate ABC transporter substrate-binding protein n=1 Tax=Streptomyces sp. NBC_01465 TaxID=2903878 RepID=UPI002E3333EA|nr:aliphatic sulfonate ABC transporter substrate-binding protein [Streptomyces sp. NBC_01465]